MLRLQEERFFRSLKRRQRAMMALGFLVFRSLFYESAKRSDEKHRKEDEQTLADLISAHCRLQAKLQLVQASYSKLIKSGYYLSYNKHSINRAAVY